LAALTQNLARLQNSPDPPQAKILQASWPRDFARLTPYGPFDLIFLDPPYEELQLPQIFLSHLHQKSLAAPGAWAVWELAPASLKAWSEGDLAPWRIKTTRIWGQKAVAILFLPDSAT
jgi:16S rRNA G966 N2-methylase RsmD